MSETKDLCALAKRLLIQCEALKGIVPDPDACRARIAELAEPVAHTYLNLYNEIEAIEREWPNQAEPQRIREFALQLRHTKIMLDGKHQAVEALRAEVEKLNEALDEIANVISDGARAGMGIMRQIAEDALTPVPAEEDSGLIGDMLPGCDDTDDCHPLDAMRRERDVYVRACNKMKQERDDLHAKVADLKNDLFVTCPACGEEYHAHAMTDAENRYIKCLRGALEEDRRRASDAFELLRIWTEGYLGSSHSVRTMKRRTLKKINGTEKWYEKHRTALSRDVGGNETHCYMSPPRECADCHRDPATCAALGGEDA